MLTQSLYHTFLRYKTLRSHKISALPIIILMPHSSCNCRCVMCDIWKGNRNLKQLEEKDIAGLLSSLHRLGTRQVVMSGGEALLHHNFFVFCDMLRRQGIHITLLTTGLTLKAHADRLLEFVNDVIISLDGDELLHDEIRNIPGAFRKISEGIAYLKSKSPAYKITGRSVIHKLNYRRWDTLIETAKDLGLNQISFLPADISSSAFNRETPWSQERQNDVLIAREELPLLKIIIEDLTERFQHYFNEKFIAESPAKLMKIYTHYRALHGLDAFPYKKCNAPWVSTVIEPDGSVRPCFFHPVIGNIRNETLDTILNSKTSVQFRRDLDMEKNEICRKCVCYLNLPPALNPATV